MMHFSIDFLPEADQHPYDNPEIPAAAGRLLFRNEREGFLANLAQWQRRDYRAQWIASLDRLIAGQFLLPTT
jgi:hypothetical protein